MRGLIVALDEQDFQPSFNQGLCRYLTPIYDKPMLCHPVSLLMKAGVRDITIVCHFHFLEQIEAFLRDGTHIGVSLKLIGKDAYSDSASILMSLGADSEDEGICVLKAGEMYYGEGFEAAFLAEVKRNRGARLFAKPKSEVVLPESNAVSQQQNMAKRANQSFALNEDELVGAYCYDASVFARLNYLAAGTSSLTLENLNKSYLLDGKISVSPWQRGDYWKELSSSEDIFDAASFIRYLSTRQNIELANLEAIAWESGWLERKDFQELVLQYGSSPNGLFLRTLLGDDQGPNFDEISEIASDSLKEA